MRKIRAKLANAHPKHKTIADLQEGQPFVYLSEETGYRDVLTTDAGCSTPLVCMRLERAPPSGLLQSAGCDVSTVVIVGPHAGRVQRSKLSTPVLEVELDIVVTI